MVFPFLSPDKIYIFLNFPFFFLGKLGGHWPSAAGMTSDLIFHILLLRISLETLASYIVA